MADPQQPDSSALAKQFGGTPSAALASQFGGTPSTQAAQSDVPPDISASAHPDVARGVGEFFSNFNPVSVAKAFMPDNTTEAAFGPAGALVGHLWDAAKERLQAAKDAHAKGDPAQAALHLVGAVPVVGPVIDKIGTAIKNKDTGLLSEGLGDLAALGVTGLGGPEAVAGKAADMAESARGGVASAADAMSAQKMTQALSPQTGANKARFGNMAAQVAPALARMDDMGAMSRPVLFDKIGSNFSDARDVLDTAADARNANKGINTQPILDRLQAERDALVAQPVQGSRVIPEVSGEGVRVGVKQATIPMRGPSGQFTFPASATGDVTLGPTAPRTQPGLTMGSARDVTTGKMTDQPDVLARPIGRSVVPQGVAPQVAQIDAAMDEIRQLGPVAHYDELKKLRSAWDTEAAPIYSPAVTSDFLAKSGSAKGAAINAGAIRETLADADPATAAANQNYSFWKQAQTVTQAAKEAEQVRPTFAKSIVAPMVGAGIGATVGGGEGAMLGTALGSVLQEASKAGYTTKIAVSRQLARFADALRSGDAGTARAALITMGTLTRTLPAINQSLSGGSR